MSALNSPDAVNKTIKLGGPDALSPLEAVERVDVVTGGASAAYGSDAVAGVVNFVLDTKFEGLKISLAGTEDKLA